MNQEKKYFTLEDKCPICGSSLRHEQNFHVNFLVCYENDHQIQVMPMEQVRPGEQQPVINPSSHVQIKNENSEKMIPESYWDGYIDAAGNCFSDADNGL